MKSKYSKIIADVIDKFWGEFNCAPTIRDIQDALKPMEVNSTSVVRYVIRHTSGIEINIHGRPTPQWVKDAIREAYEKKTKIPVSG